MQRDLQLPATTGLPPLHESWLPREHGLYRPRHGGRQWVALACALIFFLTPVAALSVGVRAEPFENKALAAAPSPARGFGFFTALPDWATDHMPLRESGVQSARWISESIFGEPLPIAEADQDPIVAGKPRPDARPPVSYPPVIYGQNGWMYIGEDVKHKCQPTMSLDEVADAVRRLRHVVEASGRRFVLVIAPDKSTMFPQFLPPRYPGKDCAEARSAQFWQRAASDLGAIDLREALRDIERKQSKRLYDPSDTHWSYEGGVAMTYALAHALDPGITRSWVLKRRGVTRWPADLATFVGKKQYRKLQTYHLAPDGRHNRVRYVASNLRRPLHLAQRGPQVPGTITEPTGMIADSFTQFGTPFLAAAFRDITVVHAETVSNDRVTKAAESLADRDVVIVELVERNIAGGTSPLLQPDTIQAIGDVLARHPR